MTLLEDRFWAKTARSPGGCWLWTGSLRSNGYGQFKVGGRSGAPRRAHRVAWEITHGPIPDGLKVLHECDVRACVNPAHLYLGTSSDNARDRDYRRRLRA